MARQHGYFVLIPAFIPVDKKSLQNQIQTGTVIHEAAQTQDLAAIMALPGIRYHASKSRDGAVKEMAARWGSVEVEAAAGESGEDTTSREHLLDEQAEHEEDVAAEEAGQAEAEADPATTNGRRSRAKAA